MSMTSEVLSIFTRYTFIILWTFSLWDYLHHRDHMHRDISLMFTSIVVTQIITILNNKFGIEYELLSLVGSFALVTQPYMMVRLVKYFRHVPPSIQYGAILGMVLSWGILLVPDRSTFPLLTLPIILYFVIVDGYTMLAFIYGAATTSGVVQKRLQFTAFGSGLFALALFWAGIGLLVPAFGDIIDILTQLSAIGSACFYYLGLAAPQWIRRKWQLEELHQFLLDINQTTTPNKILVYEFLCRAVLSLTGSQQTFIFYEDNDIWKNYKLESGVQDVSNEVSNNLKIFYQDSEPKYIETDTVEVSFREALHIGNEGLTYIVPVEREQVVLALLFVVLDNGSLFPDDDIQMLDLFAEQISILLENITLIQKLNQYSATLEKHVEQRTEELQQRNTSINLLQKITAAANATTTIEEPLYHVIEMICKTLNLPIGHAFAPVSSSLTDLESSTIWYLKYPERHNQFRQVTENTAFSIGLGGIGQAMQTNSPQWYINIGERADFIRKSIAKDTGLQTAIFIPIVLMDETVAILEFFSETLIQPDDHLLEVFAQIGTQLGRAIERKRAKSALQESEIRFRSMFEQAAVGMAHVSIEGRFTRLNQRFCDILGYTHDELTELTFQDITHPDDVETDLTYVQQVLDNEIENYSIEKRYIHKNGSQVWINLTVSLVRDENEVPLYLIRVIEDISERKRLEREFRILYDQLEQRVQERTAHLHAVNKELEAFSYSVSHDLRAPLRAIDGFSLALLEDYNDAVDEMGQQYLSLIRTESQRMGQLIDDLIALSQYSRSELQPEMINLSQLAHEIISELQRQDPTRDVTVSIQDDLTACGDKSLMRAVLQNLLDNAWKYTSKTSKPRIEFACEKVNGKSEFYVRDNGAGFDMAYSKKLFGAFQRLHRMDEFKGTGIGLATVQRIMHRHGGTIRAHGEVDNGATFYFTLGNNECQ